MAKMIQIEMQHKKKRRINSFMDLCCFPLRDIKRQKFRCEFIHYIILKYNQELFVTIIAIIYMNAISF